MIGHSHFEHSDDDDSFEGFVKSKKGSVPEVVVMTPPPAKVEHVVQEQPRAVVSPSSAPSASTHLENTTSSKGKEEASSNVSEIPKSAPPVEAKPVVQEHKPTPTTSSTPAAHPPQLEPKTTSPLCPFCRTPVNLDTACTKCGAAPLPQTDKKGKSKKQVASKKPKVPKK